MEEWQEDPKNQRHASAPGAELAAQREALGLSVDQIADQLKLAPRQVVAIEKGDYDSLPNMAVTRGFIRAYAKAVRLDPAPLVAMIEVEGAVGHATATVRPTKVTASFSESRFPTLTERQGKPVGAIIGGIAVVVVLAAAGAWKAGLISPATFGAHGTAPAATETTAPVTTQPAAEQAPLQSPNVPLISVPPQPGSSTSTPDVVPGGGVNPAPAGAQPAPGSQAAPGVQPAPAAPSATPNATPGATPNATPSAAPGAAPAGAKPAAAAPAAQPAQAAALVQTPLAAPATAAATPAAAAAPAVHEGGGKLVLTVKEDSWIEIRRPGSNSLIARLVKAGNTESFDVRAKDLVIVGKPSGVQATLAGAPMELPQVPGGTIARVNIK